MSLFEGDFIGRAVKAEIGNRSGKPIVRIEMEVTEGERKGQRASYDGKLGDENIKYTKRAMLAVGWKGQTVKTFTDDVKAANLTVPFSVEIASVTYKDSGKTREWSAVRSIGNAARPLDALDSDQLRNVDKWFAEAGDVGGEAPASASEPKLPF